MFYFYHIYTHPLGLSLYILCPLLKKKGQRQLLRVLMSCVHEQAGMCMLPLFVRWRNTQSLRKHWKMLPLINFDLKRERMENGSRCPER